MKRKIIKIDESKCNGCGLCINACHEGALQLVNGKAKLISETYCDGLGDCLPECPTGAISIEEREAAAFDETAVTQQRSAAGPHVFSPGGCPGSRLQSFERPQNVTNNRSTAAAESVPTSSELRQWPCQIKLVPVNAPYLENAHLLIAADCTAYAYAQVHRDFMRNKITLIGCPKLDQVDYSQKLMEIFKQHEIKSVTVLRMEVPCCGGLVAAVKQAFSNSGKMIPWQVVTISTDGQILAD